MQKAKRSWFKLPSKIRKPITLTVGLIFVLAAGATGWLPGPGGIPLFLIGIAILATEFEWAERLRDFALHKVKLFGQWYRARKILGTFLLLLCAGTFLTISYLFYNTVAG